MADPNPAPTAPAPKTWPDVASTALHSLAGGVLLAGVGYMTIAGYVDKGVFTTLAVAAAGAVGFAGYGAATKKD